MFEISRKLTWQEVFDIIDQKLLNSIKGKQKDEDLEKQMYEMIEGYIDWYNEKKMEE